MNPSSAVGSAKARLKSWPHKEDEASGHIQKSGERELVEKLKMASRVLIVQADRLGSGNMRSAVQDVFPDANVTIARSGEAALSSVDDEKFDLVVLGLSAADLVWMDELPQILNRLRDTPVLVISGRHAPRTFRALYKFRTLSIFDPVSQGPMDLRVAVSKVVDGRRYLSPTVAETMGQERDVKPETMLSGTEERILSVIGDGSDDAEASERLSVALATLATHRRNIMKKLDLHHRGELVRFALKHGYVTRTLDGSLVPGLIAILSRVDGSSCQVER